MGKSGSGSNIPDPPYPQDKEDRKLRRWVEDEEIKIIRRYYKIAEKIEGCRSGNNIFDCVANELERTQARVVELERAVHLILAESVPMGSDYGNSKVACIAHKALFG